MIDCYTLNIRTHSFIADLPARAAFLNIKQFNGYYGCLNCFHPGEYSDTFNKVIFKPHENVSLFFIYFLKGFIKLKFLIFR